ncbi:MAG: alanine racemase [Nanoarchaeota archaeon]|nr:alanine racemase [Nanoarchaeota archaeon]
MNRLITLFRKWRLRDYTPMIEVLVHKNRLLENLHAFQGAYPRMEIAPVLKSNAYGHGLLEIANILDQENCPFLCVDSYFEALTLRTKKIRSPILVIGYTEPANLKRPPLQNIAYAIVGMDHLREIEKNLSSPTSFHLKLDTGMHRQGILPKEVPEAIALIKKNPRIKIQGVFSHFADADTKNSAFTERQIETWNKLVRVIRSEISEVRYTHLAATTGSAFSKKIDANVIRLGLGLYGYDMYSERNISPKPVLEMRTKITSVREIEKGEFVGYNLTFKAPKKMKIATIPTGYYEGVDRRLGNKGFVSIEGRACKIIGRVSMNMASIDISNIPEEHLKKSVIVISAEPYAKNSVASMARLCKTSHHEILIHIPAHLRRVVV